MKKHFVCLQIHSCFASCSSRDVSLEKQIDNDKEVEKLFEACKKLSSHMRFSEEISQDDLIKIFYFEEKTFYEKGLHERGHKGYEDTNEFKQLVNGFLDLGFVKERFQEVKDYYKRDLDRYYAKKKAAGYVLHEEKVIDYHTYQGGFSDEVFNHPKLLPYVQSGHACGYIGHSIRKKALDTYIEKQFLSLKPKVVCDSIMLFCNWLTSTDGRHFGDSLEDMSLEQQKKEVDKRIHNMFKIAYVYSLPEHEGTSKSTQKLMNDLVFDNDGQIIEDKKAPERAIMSKGW